MIGVAGGRVAMEAPTIEQGLAVLDIEGVREAQGRHDALGALKLVQRALFFLYK